MTQTPRLSISFMPELLPDELLYSLIGRLTSANVLGTPKARIEKLFGTKDAVPSVDLPCLVNSLQRRLGENSPWRSSSELIETATIYPYHRPFLTPLRHKLIEKILLNGNGKALKVSMGRVANRFGAAPPLRYCPICINEDIANHGVSYWHRAHQLPGVTSCYLHAVKLLNHFGFAPTTDKRRLLLAPSESPSNSLICEQEPQQVEFAILSRELLTAGLPALDAKCRQAVYRNALIGLGLTRKGRVDYQALAQAVRQYYCDFARFSHRERLLSSERNPLCWLHPLLERPASSSHPICHLLLIGFLFRTVAKFMQAITSKLPPSLSGQMACDRSAGKQEVGRPCEELLRNEKLSCREVARLASLSVTTVVKYRRVLGIPIRERRKYLDAKRLDSIIRALEDGSALSEIAKVHDVSISTLYRLRSQFPEIFRSSISKRQTCELVNRRRHWLLTIEAYRNAGQKAARAAAASTYAWLYRHDRKWLLKNNKKFASSRVTRLRVNWQERDVQLCEQASAYVSRVKCQEKRPRISRTLMTRYLGEALIRRNIDRLPRLKSLLDQLEESSFTYQLFRIDRSVESLSEKGQPLTNWRIQRSAGIQIWTEMHNAYTAWKIKELATVFKQ